jgi:hypothetical protein
MYQIDKCTSCHLKIIDKCTRKQVKLFRLITSFMNIFEFENNLDL